MRSPKIWASDAIHVPRYSESCELSDLLHGYAHILNIKIWVQNPYNSTLAISPGPGTSKNSHLSMKLMGKLSRQRIISLSETSFIFLSQSGYVTFAFYFLKIDICILKTYWSKIPITQLWRYPQALGHQKSVVSVGN